LRAAGLLEQCIPARDASDAEIERVHAPRYLELVERETEAATSARYLSTGDTVIDASSLRAARRAAGGALAAVETSAAGGEAVFALVRPPGHHAEPAQGMGFCLFNNVAIAARSYQAMRAADEPRVLIADFDYHHGNGTEAVAGEGVSYFSTHAYPAYPGTGSRSYRRGADLVVNVPLPVGGVATETFVALWEELLPQVARVVRPHMLIVSAGFDYVAGDSVGDLGVGVEAAAPLAAAIRRVAAEYCNGAVAYVLEGGYDLDALTRSIASIADVSDAAQSPAPLADPKAIPSDLRESMRELLRIPQGSP
jgi:acetoin utilization deacetylase AcuC-like enzyme